jgi:polysaccharide export outer membrane protein
MLKKENELTRRTMLLFAIVLLTLSLQAFSQDVSQDYKIGPKDLLDIRVFGHDEMSATVRVSEDGKITLPLLGAVAAQGFTKQDLEKRLEEQLGERYYQNPQVTVFIQEYKSNIVSIFGAVRNPGNFELLGRQTLMQIIAMAGGTTGEQGKEIIIFRQQEDGTSDSLKISTEGLLDNGDPELNIPLRPGDVVRLPIDKSISIYMSGQVRNPGRLEVKKSDLPTFTLLKAIAQAGGFTERAAKTRVKIIRRDENGQEVIIKVNVKDLEKLKKPDIKLIENDVIIVPETIF